LFRHNTTARDKHDNLVDPYILLTNIHDMRQKYIIGNLKKKRLIIHQNC